MEYIWKETGLFERRVLGRERERELRREGGKSLGPSCICFKREWNGVLGIRGARNKSTLATYMQHYNDDINYFKPQPYLCTGPLSKGMELIMQLRAGILPLNAMTAKIR